MMMPVEVKPGVYWVGAIDWTSREFHGYKIYRGTTYNAYLIVDDKITLIDTVKAPFANEMIERISQVIDPSKIDYIVSNHVEMDHSGSIPAVMKLAPEAKIYTSDPNGAKGLTAHYGDLGYVPVKDGDTLEIGKRTLSFVKTTMVHWPDSMVTYDVTDKILFSNDAFGQHFASNLRFDDEEDLASVLGHAKKYYANIVMPYSKNAAKAVEACKGLDIDIIAPGHGIIWRSHVDEILKCYEKWTSCTTDDKAVVVYDSMWGTTDKMARTIVSAFAERGISARLFDLKVDHNSDVITEVLCAKYIAVGSPTLNNGMLPNVASFLCYLKGLTQKNKVGIAFGSYGWAPKGPNDVAEQLGACGYEMPFETFTQNWTPTDDDLKALHDKFLEKLDEIRK
ncbi:MAG: FprA family A-type flavoprotein [Coriobacteriales bacterium]|jgi:flavorubredoxin